MFVTAGVIESSLDTPLPRLPAPSYSSFSLLQDQGLQKSVLRKKKNTGQSNLSSQAVALAESAMWYIHILDWQVHAVLTVTVSTSYFL